MLNEKSRMKGDFQVRFCERLGLKCPCLLDRWLFGFSFYHQHLIINLALAAGRKEFYCRHNAKPFSLAGN